MWFHKVFHLSPQLIFAMWPSWATKDANTVNIFTVFLIMFLRLGPAKHRTTCSRFGKPTFGYTLQNKKSFRNHFKIRIIRFIKSMIFERLLWSWTVWRARLNTHSRVTKSRNLIGFLIICVKYLPNTEWVYRTRNLSVNKLVWCVY